MRRTPSLRARVAVAAALAIAIAVALLGVATLTLVDRQLHRSLDRALRARAVEVAQLNATTPKLITAAGVLEGRVGTSAAYVQVVDREGRIVARSAALGGRVLQNDGPLRRALTARSPSYGSDRLGSEPLRVYAAPLSGIGGGPAAGGAVAVAGSTTGITATVEPLRGLVVLAAVAAALIAGAAAILLTRRALRPLTDLTHGAEAIAATGDPGRRMPGGGHDEVGRLAGTLNAMLDSLDRARQRERQFVDDASHELRTPLTALRGNAAYVARHGADPAVLADIEQDAERLAALLDDLLALAREDAGAPPAAERVDLAAVARAVATGRDRVTVHAPDGAVPAVRGDREALARALRNLIENAERHGPPRGPIDVTVAHDPVAAVVRVAVADSGPGLTPDQAERAFARFWRGPDAAPGGSGLGLAIVRATAERHGGRVTVAGATFTVELPARQADAPPAGPRRSDTSGRATAVPDQPAGTGAQPLAGRPSEISQGPRVEHRRTST